MKVVACSYQTMFENAQVSLMSSGTAPKVRMVMSPILTMTYGAKVTENACKMTDPTKCIEAACSKTGVAGVLQDTSDQITARDCTSFESVKEADNPNFPFCKYDRDCPSKLCINTKWTKYII